MLRCVWVVFGQYTYEKKAKTKLVESLFIICLDAGSIPADSTKEPKTLRTEATVKARFSVFILFFKQPSNSLFTDDKTQFNEFYDLLTLSLSSSVGISRYPKSTRIKRLSTIIISINTLNVGHKFFMKFALKTLYKTENNP